MWQKCGGVCCQTGSKAVTRISDGQPSSSSNDYAGYGLINENEEGKEITWHRCAKRALAGGSKDPVYQTGTFHSGNEDLVLWKKLLRYGSGDELMGDGKRRLLTIENLHMKDFNSNANLWMRKKEISYVWWRNLVIPHNGVHLFLLINHIM